MGRIHSIRGPEKPVLDSSMMPFWVTLAVFSIALLSTIWVIMRHLSLRPSNDRSWVNDNERQAKAEFDGDEVTIRM